MLKTVQTLQIMQIKWKIQIKWDKYISNRQSKISAYQTDPTREMHIK